MAAKIVNNDEIVYEEFEPLCKWQRREDKDVLEIHLQEFKKEELKVQISNHGILKISGERALDASKHAKFLKEIPVPSHKYEAHAIQAKFVNNNLIITLPKVKISIPEKIDQTPKPGSTTGAPDIGGKPKEQTPTPRLNASTECGFEDRKRPKMGLSKVAAVSLLVAAVAALLAYVIYMYRSTVGLMDE